MKKIKSFKKLEVVKLQKTDLYKTLGGKKHKTKGTRSICHIDGVIEGDPKH